MRIPVLIVAVLTLGSGACSQKMATQPAFRPLQFSDFWEDDRSARPLVPGTVARGELHEDEAFYTGKLGGEFVNLVPTHVDRALLERGRERYDIFCSPCHDRLGNGRGMVVRRGFPQPPSLHLDRLREAKPGYLFDVITRGFGRQPQMASQIPASDRWAIVAYLKVLQYSQHAPLESVPSSDRSKLEAVGAAGDAAPGGASGREEEKKP